jgi:hypothetical protein
MNFLSRLMVPVALSALVELTGPGPIHSQKPLVRLTAFAVDLNAPGGAATGTVEMAVTRWSTDAERDRLMTTLIELGPARLREVLSKLPPVGYIRTPDSLAYDLHYARQTPMGEDERIVLVTDRPIAFWEASHLTHLTDYPFTVIELRVKPNGEGEGKLSLAAKITADKNTHAIALEDYGQGPVLLKAVKREKG